MAGTDVGRRQPRAAIRASNPGRGHEIGDEPATARFGDVGKGGAGTGRGEYRRRGLEPRGGRDPHVHTVGHATEQQRMRPKG
ncbi:hypothetical protein [Nocardia sp. CA-290969]|uniref:hypothetical protein n=1 Tax=Nocardia sp. CA-290969 TaxID=3239986 RepID=UPI003D8AF992